MLFKDVLPVINSIIVENSGHKLNFLALQILFPFYSERDSYKGY
jgi:hypothetical protein